MGGGTVKYGVRATEGLGPGRFGVKELRELQGFQAVGCSGFRASGGAGGGGRTL